MSLMEILRSWVSLVFCFLICLSPIGHRGISVLDDLGIELKFGVKKWFIGDLFYRFEPVLCSSWLSISESL